MDLSTSPAANKPHRKPWVLHSLTVIFVGFYIAVFIDEGFPLPIRDFGHLCVFLLFGFAMVGFIFSWFKRKIAGYLFILWYILEVLVGSFIWEDAGMAIVLGFPLLPIGIFYLLYANRKNRNPQPGLQEQLRLFLWLSILSGLAIHLIAIADNLTALPPASWISGAYLYLHLLYMVYVVAFVLSRRYELITGILLVVYYLTIIFLLQIRIIDDMGPYGMFTFPLLILGLLYLLYAVKEKPKRDMRDNNPG